MFRTVSHRRDECLRRMMTCACGVALLTLMPAMASAERQSGHSGIISGTVLSLTPNEETSKKKKKLAPARNAESKQAPKIASNPKPQIYQIDPAQQVINADSGQKIVKVDPGQAFTFDPEQQVLKIDPGQQVLDRKKQVYQIDLSQRVIVEPAASVPGVDVVDGVQVPKDITASGDPDTVPGDLVAATEDPLEGINRVVFGFNEVVDRLVFEPAARIYRFVVPRPVRIAVINVINNFATPITLTNDILQGNPEAAANTIKRFMVNSTLGIGGIFDHATGLGEPLHREDFGQTLGTWGINGNPYIVLPILGPSNPRDMVGTVADTAVDPMTWVLYDAPLWQRAIPPGVKAVSGREQLLDDYDNLRKNSPDLYASVRDLYAQKRQAEIANEASGYGPASGESTLPPASIPRSLNPY
jgi:ABC-type transporter lipoprotein component MlaA